MRRILLLILLFLLLLPMATAQSDSVSVYLQIDSITTTTISTTTTTLVYAYYLNGNSTWYDGNTTLPVRCNSTTPPEECFRDNVSVKITYGDRTDLEFVWDANNSILNVSNIRVLKDQTLGVTLWAGAIVIRGCGGLMYNGTKKTAYVSRIAGYNSVCVKDAEVFNITEVSSNCKGANETLVACNSSKNGLTCTVVDNDTYKVTGLRHSAILEMGETPSGDIGGGDSGRGGIMGLATATTSTIPNILPQSATPSATQQPDPKLILIPIIPLAIYYALSRKPRKRKEKEYAIEEKTTLETIAGDLQSLYKKIRKPKRDSERRGRLYLP